MTAEGRPLVCLLLFLGSWTFFRATGWLYLNTIGRSVVSTNVKNQTLPDVENNQRLKARSQAMRPDQAAIDHLKRRPVIKKMRHASAKESVRRDPAKQTYPIDQVPIHTTDSSRRTDTAFNAYEETGVAPSTDEAQPSKLHSRRWVFSGWASFRGGGARSGLAAEGFLGGSQAGMRALRPFKQLTPRLDLTLAVRSTVPVATRREKEAAVGLGMRFRGRFTAELLAERRFGVSRGGRNAFALVSAVGASDLPLGESLSLDGYAQAGFVGLRRREKFIDGSANLTHRVYEEGDLRLSLGAGIWGGAQPSAARLDAGPGAILSARTNNANIRITTSWRFDMAGEAKPGSGPAIGIAADF